MCIRICGFLLLFVSTVCVWCVCVCVCVCGFVRVSERESGGGEEAHTIVKPDELDTQSLFFSFFLKACCEGIAPSGVNGNHSALFQPPLKYLCSDSCLPERAASPFEWLS